MATPSYTQNQFRRAFLPENPLADRYDPRIGLTVANSPARLNEVPKDMSLLGTAKRAGASLSGLLSSNSSYGNGNPVQENLANVMAKVTGLEGRENLLLGDGLSPVGVTGERKPLTQVPEQAAKSEPQITPNTTLGELEEMKVTAQRKQMMERQDAISSRTREQLLAEGADEKQLEGWDKFADQFDLTTVGLALLANNDGGDVFANLGKALLLGKAQKDQYRTEDLEQANLDREYLMKAFDTESKIGRRADETRIGDENVSIKKGQLAVSAAGVPIAQQRADAATLAAQAAGVRAQASMQMSPQDKKVVADAATAWLANKGVSKDTAAALGVNFSTDAQELAQKTGLSYGEAMDMMFEDYQMDGTIQPTGFFSFSDFE
jgi:hypothetical protein